MSPPRQGAVHKVRLLDSEWAWVNEEAERLGVSAAQVVRNAVRDLRWKSDAKAQEKRIAEMADRIKAIPGPTRPLG